MTDETKVPNAPAMESRSAGRETTVRVRHGAFVLMAVVLCACGTTTATLQPSRTVSYPPVPAGGTNCGIENEMSGWPTTTIATPAVYSCLTEALSSGHPARFIQIKPSRVYTGDKTRDGYSIPAGIVITYQVFGAAQLQVTTNRRETGGPVTTQNCTGLSQPTTFGSEATPTGCKAG
jgi:hypothetical protein